MTTISKKCNNKRFLYTVIASSIVAASSQAFALESLSGAIFTTTPDGTIVNENVRYANKQEVFLDGGPGPNAPGHAAALPAGWYYFQVTDPSGKCLLSSKEAFAGQTGGTCGTEGNKKGSPKAQSAGSFEAEPLACRLFYFDGVGGVTFANASYPVTVKEKGKEVVVDMPCRHVLGSEFEPKLAELPDGGTIQLYPFANTPNNGGVYKAWVSPEERVQQACYGLDLDMETGTECDGFFGFIPRYSKTDNFKVKLERGVEPESYDIGLRAFHDKNLNCKYDPNYVAPLLGEELISNWDFGVTDPSLSRNYKRTLPLEAYPVTFSVLGQAVNARWSIDHFMWFADQ